MKLSQNKVTCFPHKKAIAPRPPLPPTSLSIHNYAFLGEESPPFPGFKHPLTPVGARSLTGSVCFWPQTPGVLSFPSLMSLLFSFYVLNVTAKSVLKPEIMEPFWPKVSLGGFNKRYNHCWTISNKYFAYN